MYSVYWNILQETMLSIGIIQEFYFVYASIARMIFLVFNGLARQIFCLGNFDAVDLMLVFVFM